MLIIAKEKDIPVWDVPWRDNCMGFLEEGSIVFLLLDAEFSNSLKIISSEYIGWIYKGHLGSSLFPIEGE